MNAIPETIKGISDTFCIRTNNQNQIISITNLKDCYEMNWVKGNHAAWGTVKTDLELSIQVTRSFTEHDTFMETYTFKNDTDFDICTMGTRLGIYTPFPDYYMDAAVCLTQCCHTHIWCGGASSYIMALRMGGEAPNLGVVLREGSIKGYSVERMASTTGREEELSNHRGDFILHPENLHLKPGDEYTLSWELFWFQDKKEFRKILMTTPDFIHIEAEEFLLLGKNAPTFSFHICTDDRTEAPIVMNKGRQVSYIWKDGWGEVSDAVKGMGEYSYEIMWKGKKTRAVFLIQPDIEELASRRCNFIVEKQQCYDKESYLYGAYLIYDNEEKQQYYEHLNDHNGGRERMGMGILMAYYLQKHPCEKLQKSLDAYVQYVLNELFDKETGEVFNDAPRCRDYIRLYNNPWISRFFLEMYQLNKEEAFLDYYYKSVKYFYQEGGSHFYAIGMPMYESIQIFRKAGKKAQAEKLLLYYEEQGAFILSCGKNYPAHEVDYEQSIVAPAAIYMCELYRLTGNEKYRQAAEEQIAMLDLFQGFQPDYHMNEVAIRHWDGYWFGKRKCLGDTYPHYWSALSGYAYAQMNKITNSNICGKKAKKTLQAVLSLLHEDGSASCAMVYPMSVNGTIASFYDPWANDQDWGLYFALKYL